MANIKYDLEERTAQFGLHTIKFCKLLPKDEITRPLINQLVRAATSIGANYAEADDAVSLKDFRNKVGICKKEARECKHFLRMVVAAVPKSKHAARVLWNEARELNLILNAIYRKTNQNN